MTKTVLVQLNAGLWCAWAAYWLISAKYVEQTKASEGIGKRASHLIPLIVGFTLIFSKLGEQMLGLPQFHLHLSMLIVGEAITLAGLLFTVWARVHLGRYWSGAITLKQGHRLIQSGPYRIVRHPIYTGFLVGALGSALLNASVGAILGFLVLSTAYAFKVRREETVLTSEFSDEYSRYKSETPALIPLRIFRR